MNTKKRDPYLALRYKEFRAYVLARFLITIALTMQAVIIGYEVYELTNSKILLGLIGLTEAIPAIGIALYGGYVADKSEKRNMLVAFISLYTVMCALLLVFTHSDMIASIGKENVVILIFFIIFFTGIARSFSGPASFGLAAQIVPREVYQSSITWASTAWQSGAVLGPAVGGILLGKAGITFTFGIIVVFSMHCHYFVVDD
jgi:MFS family permease